MSNNNNNNNNKDACLLFEWFGPEFFFFGWYPTKKWNFRESKKNQYMSLLYFFIFFWSLSNDKVPPTINSVYPDIHYIYVCMGPTIHNKESRFVWLIALTIDNCFFFYAFTIFFFWPIIVCDHWMVAKESLCQPTRLVYRCRRRRRQSSSNHFVPICAPYSSVCAYVYSLFTFHVAKKKYPKPNQEGSIKNTVYM